MLQRGWKALIKRQNTVAETNLLPFNLREKWPGGEQHTAAFYVGVLAQGFQSHCDFLGQGVRTWVLGMSRYSQSVYCGGTVQVQSVMVILSRYSLSWWDCLGTVYRGGTVKASGTESSWLQYF